MKDEKDERTQETAFHWDTEMLKYMLSLHNRISDLSQRVLNLEDKVKNLEGKPDEG